MRRRSSLVVRTATVVAAAAGPAVFCLPAASTARGATTDFHLVDQSVAVDLTKQTATFTLKFDEKPDFVPSPGAGGQPMAFQYEIDGDSTSFSQPLAWEDIDSVIRGSEIGAGQGLPVRDRSGDGGGAEAGGWGPMRALLPYQIEDDTLTFTAGLSALGDTDGKFRYRVMTIENGSVTSEAQGAVIPLPAAWGTGLTVLTALGVGRVVRMRRGSRG